MKRLLLFLILSCCLSFGQDLTFTNQTIGTDLKLELNEDQSFVLVDAGNACEGLEFETNTYRGTYTLSDKNILKLNPREVIQVKGKSVWNREFEKHVDKIESKTILKFDSTNSSISLSYELFKFNEFNLLLRQDFSSTYELDYVDDYSELFNLLNGHKEISKEDYYIFKHLFLTSSLEQKNISLDHIRQSDLLKNRKEIFKESFTAQIISFKERRIKNDSYEPGFDENKFITYLDIEINAGSEDGFYSGIQVYFKTKTTCNPYALEQINVVKEVTTHKSYMTIFKSSIDGCDPKDYILNKEIIVKSYLNN